MNGHLVVLEVLVESFTTLPIGESLGRLDFQALVLRFSWVMAAAILIGLPAITALLIVNISFGVMMRAAPQLNIFSRSTRSTTVEKTPRSSRCVPKQYDLDLKTKQRGSVISAVAPLLARGSNLRY